MRMWEGKVDTSRRICQNVLEVCDAWRVHVGIKLCISIIIVNLWKASFIV